MSGCQPGVVGQQQQQQQQNGAGNGVGMPVRKSEIIILKANE